MISMFIDHLNKRILLNYLIDSENSNILLIILQSIFAILGRIAFPIFLFLLVEGFKHTHSKKKIPAKLDNFCTYI